MQGGQRLPVVPASAYHRCPRARGSQRARDLPRQQRGGRQNQLHESGLRLQHCLLDPPAALVVATWGGRPPVCHQQAVYPEAPKGQRASACMAMQALGRDLNTPPAGQLLPLHGGVYSPRAGAIGGLGVTTRQPMPLQMEVAGVVRCGGSARNAAARVSQPGQGLATQAHPAQLQRNQRRTARVA